MCRKNNVDKVVGMENKQLFSVKFNHFQEKRKKRLGLPLLARLIILGINVYVALEVNS